MYATSIERQCATCGLTFIGNWRALYCSLRCKNKMAERKRSDRDKKARDKARAKALAAGRTPPPDHPQAPPTDDALFINVDHLDTKRILDKDTVEKLRQARKEPVDIPQLVKPGEAPKFTDPAILEMFPDINEEKK